MRGSKRGGMKSLIPSLFSKRSKSLNDSFYSDQRAFQTEKVQRTHANPKLIVTEEALAPLVWSARHTNDENVFWGVIEKSKNGFRLVSVELAKHAASPGFCDPDMEWYGDWVIEQTMNNKEMWQLGCWIHTHPSGCTYFSSVDTSTFEDSFGNHKLAFMIVMTKDLQFIGRACCNEKLPDSGGVFYGIADLDISFENENAEPNEKLAAQLEEQYKERVSKYMGNRWDVDNLPKRVGRSTRYSDIYDYEDYDRYDCKKDYTQYSSSGSHRGDGWGRYNRDWQKPIDSAPRQTLLNIVTSSSLYWDDLVRYVASSRGEGISDDVIMSLSRIYDYFTGKGDKQMEYSQVSMVSTRVKNLIGYKEFEKEVENELRKEIHEKP